MNILMLMWKCQGSLAGNDPRLCEGQGLELQIFNKPQKMIRNTNVDVTDKALPFAKHVLAVVRI